jgi:enamine deaminase RidA (YjgF/YER057c/UK114 family)
MLSIDQKLAELGVVLPDLAAPIANYMAATMHNRTLYISGQLPRNGDLLVTGQVGRDLTVAEGAEAARLCAIAVLAAAKAALLGDLGRIEQCLVLNGFVNAPAEFTDHPRVMNGASDLLVAILGDSGKHSRAAVGVSSLPLGAAVEVSACFALTS